LAIKETKFQDFELQITLKVTSTVVDIEPSEEELSVSLSNELTHWDDGRYDFSSEMIQDGAERIFKNALIRFIQHQFFKKYGNEMVEVSPGFQTNKGYLESKKVTDEVCCHIVEPVKVEVKKIKEENHG